MVVVVAVAVAVAVMGEESEIGARGPGKEARGSNVEGSGSGPKL